VEITKAQIKKIHTLKSLLNLEDSFYEALLFRYGVESSKELSKDKAISLIEVLTDIQKEQNNKNKNSTGLSLHRKIYFNRRNKATDNQINYISKLWWTLSDKKDYKSLMWFIKKITSKLYIHIESLELQEASNTIVVLEKWNKQKEINL
jgi:hypothetical protein